MNACTVKGTWRRVKPNFACTKPVEDTGFGGSPVLSFCDDKLCAIGIAITPEATDFETWNQSFVKVRDVLVARHGEPTTSTETVPDECKNEKFVVCLESGTAEKELTWVWDAHLVSLRMSKKKTSDGPPAIRLVSMPKPAAPTEPQGSTAAE